MPILLPPVNVIRHTKAQPMPEQRKSSAVSVVSIVMSQNNNEMLKNSGAYRLVSLILNTLYVKVAKTSDKSEFDGPIFCNKRISQTRKTPSFEANMADVCR